VQVQSLKRIGDKWLKLKFALINDSNQQLDTGVQFADPERVAHGKDSRQVTGITLIGEPGNTSYLVARDKEDTAVCSRSIDDLKPKSKIELWAQFPAPPEDVQKLTVSIPHFAPVKDVPISTDTSATTTGDGQQAGTRVQVESLKLINGKWLKLQFAMINDSNEQLDVAGRFKDPEQKNDERQVSGVTLIDQNGKTKYFVLRDMKDAAACSHDVQDLAPKSRVELWAQFPAPPPGVKTLTVSIPYFEPVDDVPISS
jgi:hypothetical protein